MGLLSASRDQRFLDGHSVTKREAFFFQKNIFSKVPDVMQKYEKLEKIGEGEEEEADASGRFAA